MCMALAWPRRFFGSGRAEHRPWAQLVPGPTKNLICAINEYKRKHYQLRCVVYDIQRAPYGGDYGPIGHASWEKRFMIWG